LQLIYLDEPDLNYIPSTRGEDVAKFEKACAEYLGVRDCVAVNSGTSALFLALISCGIGRGDVVLVPASTFIGTANAVLMTGAEVKLLDIDIGTWCLPNNDRSYDDKKIKAIIPVSLYGCCFSIIQGNPALIFDIAEGFPARPPADPYMHACYSFNGNKTITTGGGGLIIGWNLYQIRKMLIPGYYDGLGYNLGMPAINARLGLQQLKKADEYIAKKNRFNEIYRNELSFLTFQESTGQSTWWMTACLFPESIKIEDFQDRLFNRGIPTRRVFKPLNFYAHMYDSATYKNAEYIYKHGLCLPSSVRNTEDGIYKVCGVIRELIGRSVS